MTDIFQTLKELNAWSVAFRIFLALFFGGCIGLERGRHGRAAGLRTHTLVCVGAALTALVGTYSNLTLNPASDPLRVGAQVISGIGFLGVGTILVRDRTRVTGLTTAAGLWATASIGLAVGIGFYFAALMAFLAVFITIEFMIHIEKKTKNKNYYLCYVECTESDSVKELYRELRPYASQVDIIPAKSGIASHVGFELRALNRAKYEELLQKAEEHQKVLIALPIES